MKLLFIMSFILLGFNVHAQTYLRPGVPSVAGSGCANGSAQVVLSSDQQTLSILFDDYIAQAPNAVGSLVDQKSCNLAVPISIPQGYQVSFVAMDYRGFIGLPAGAQALFTARHNFTGVNAAGGIKAPFFGSKVENFSLQSSSYEKQNVQWTPCNGSQQVTMNIWTNLSVQASSSGEVAQMALDSIDGQMGIKYAVKMRKCGGFPGGAGHPRPPRYVPRFIGR